MTRKLRIHGVCNGYAAYGSVHIDITVSSVCLSEDARVRIYISVEEGYACDAVTIIPAISDLSYRSRAGSTSLASWVRYGSRIEIFDDYGNRVVMLRPSSPTEVSQLAALLDSILPRKHGFNDMPNLANYYRYESLKRLLALEEGNLALAPTLIPAGEEI